LSLVFTGMTSDATFELEDKVASNASFGPVDLLPAGIQKRVFNLPKNVYRYTQEHLLCDTHGTMVKNDNANIVVNFVGWPLPRCDRGDREYYCLTMLVLFKPWRSGLHLKEEILS
jgi:hypothetical protein